MERYLREQLGKAGFGRVSESRSRTMSSIRGRNNKTTERRLKMEFVRRGLKGWRVHLAELPGRPDFVFFSARVVVFVDGCFWHGCSLCGHVPKTNSRFWSAKINRNKERDACADAALRKLGFTVVRLWECELKGDRLQRATASVVSAVRLGRLGRRVPKSGTLRRQLQSVR